MDGLIYIYSPLFLQYVAPSTQYFVWIALIFSLTSIFLVGFVFHLPESLKYSLAKLDIMKFENDREYICHMNKTPDKQVDWINLLVQKYIE
jgi:hypothetical protein